MHFFRETRNGSNKFPYPDDMFRVLNAEFIKTEAFKALEKNASGAIFNKMLGYKPLTMVTNN